MPIQFSTEIVNKHIAPGVSTFTQADIPDMSTWAKESSHWIANFLLNSSLSASFKFPMNAYAYNFIRRAQAAFTQHQLARDCTLGFLTAGGQSPTRYCDALFHWETYLGQSWHAYSLLLKAFSGTAFKKGDGSVEERLNLLFNAMKHVESRIENGQMLLGATVPVWLTNDGLCSVDAIMSYGETGEILKQLATWADALMNPQTAKEAFANLDA
jgi:hypothetical protein